jgi:hypothetical protein
MPHAGADSLNARRRGRTAPGSRLQVQRMWRHGQQLPACLQLRGGHGHGHGHGQCRCRRARWMAPAPDRTYCTACHASHRASRRCMRAFVWCGHGGGGRWTGPAGRPATEHKGQVDGSAGATPTAMPVHESQRGVVLAVSVCSIAVYVRALAFHAGGGCGLLESGQRHARVLQMAVKSPQTWLLAVLFCIGMDLILAVQVVYRVYPKGDWHSDRSNTY